MKYFRFFLPKPTLLTSALTFITLTIITQVGGVIYLLSWLISKQIKIEFKFKHSITFLGLYLIFTFSIIPYVAPFYGREKVKNTRQIRPVSYISIVLNRNYIKPELNNFLSEVEKNLQGTSIKITYLDANFPFIDKFSLFPHLSHNDGKKIDLSLIYEDESGKVSEKQKSISGYGIFENPQENEFNQIKKCLDFGYFQYDYPKYLTLGKVNSNLTFSEVGTKQLVDAILKVHGLGKLFIEPHLKQRLGLRNSKVRYHGCRAVRHDDHIHLQLL